MNENLFMPKSGKFREMEAEAQMALGLLDSETADQIIGEQHEDYQALIKGTRSAMTMLWMLMKSFGVKENQKSLKGFSQAMMIMLTLVHYAYALGIRRGRDDG